MGGGTILVSLPKEWTQRTGVRRGSLIQLQEAPDGALLLYPFRREERATKELETTYPRTEIQLLVNDITGSYLLGYDLIRITGKARIAPEHRELIRKALRHLPGIEIVDEDASTIVAQFLLDPATLDPEKLFRRVHAIVLAMLRDLFVGVAEREKDVLESLPERDDEVDRLYFLLVRLIRTAVMDLALASQFRLTPLDCLDYRVAANLLEGVGDAVVGTARELLVSPESGASRPERELFRLTGERLAQMQELAVRALLKRSAEDARAVIRIYAEIEEYWARAIKDQGDRQFTTHLASASEKIGRLLVDVADLAVPLYPMVR
jgi:phosphate uptake regulator